MIALAFLISLEAAQARVSLIREEESRPVEVVVPKAVEAPRKAKATEGASSAGNLPSYYVGSRGTSFAENPVIVPQNRSVRRMDGLNPGDVLDASIRESVIAFADSKAPVRALVRKGVLKGMILLGEATLEKNSKRILVSFTKVRKANESEPYSLQASALDLEGILGLVGKVESGEGLYFGAEILAAGAAGYADATVERKETLTGYADAPTLANASRKAIAAALGRTADRFSDKLRSVPEYAVLKGPVDIKIIVTDDVVQK